MNTWTVDFSGQVLIQAETAEEAQRQVEQSLSEVASTYDVEVSE
jgi:hypothetical protein